MVEPGEVLWRPGDDARKTSALGRFLSRAESVTGLHFADYEAAWQWSVSDLDTFWQLVWEHAGIMAHREPTAVLGRREMPFAQWFPGATVNYAEHALRDRSAAVRVKARSQTRASQDLSGAELAALVGRVQQGLRVLGVSKGDRVVGYLPNISEALVTYLAAAGLGAVWCSVPIEMGPRSVLDRVAQLDPKVLVYADGYRWGERTVHRREQAAEIWAQLADVRVIEVPYLDAPAEPPADVITWAALTATHSPPTFEALPFDHPLVVLFSSGTTGLPKAIVHGHGGLLLEHAKALSLQMDVGPGDVGFWYTTTGWMVWNILVSGLIVGATVVLFDGDPAWPDLGAQWAVAAETKATLFGTSAGYLAACARSNLRPGDRYDLAALRELTSSGSPLSAAASAWVYDAVKSDVLLAPTSGGTDVCSGFVGGSSLTPVYAGEMSCRPLGVATESFDEEGKPLRGKPGELVVTLPMPSMPVAFWNDADGSRYRAAYFDVYRGIWRHGDWIIHTERDTWVITGRSDATLNRGGVRLGTAEFYSVLDALPEVADSVVVHLEDDVGHGSLIALIVAASPTHADQDSLRLAIAAAIRGQLSPRHVPDAIVFVDALPRNNNGKRLEVPLKRAAQGTSIERAVDLSALDNPAGFVEAVAAITDAVAVLALGQR
jgi:acetoacetyl-CoA synthetase